MRRDTQKSPPIDSLNLDSTITTDVLIVWAPESQGSIMALVLSRLGHQVTVVDQCKHPRFAIGESSTPVADACLAEIAREFDLPELAPLASHSATREHYPSLVVGRKRGFSYFWHDLEKPFESGRDHCNEMVAAASPSNESADSHWCRSDIDAKLVSLFGQYNIGLIEETTIRRLERQKDKWRVEIQSNRLGRSIINASFLVDASGSAGVVLRHLGIPRDHSVLKTCTTATFGHFAELQRWSELVEQESSKDHPFVCDEAAVHHVTNDGWMWQLRFDNGITSCGVVAPVEKPSRHDQNGATNPNKLKSWLQRFPSLNQQFQAANLVAPTQGIVSSPRIQYYSITGSGKGWVALPNTVGFVDPLHSKGIAHGLSGILRIARRLGEYGIERAFSSELPSLTRQFQKEIRFIDQLVSLCYASLENFQLFRLATLWYFAAATNFESKGMDPDAESGFLDCQNESFCQDLKQYRLLVERNTGQSLDPQSLIHLERNCRTLLENHDRVGLFTPKIPNMYGKTGVESKKMKPIRRLDA